MQPKICIIVSTEYSMSGITIKPLTQELIPLYLEAFSEPVKRALHVTNNSSEEEYLLTHLVDPGASVFFVIFLGDICIGAIAIRDKKRFPGQLYSWVNHEYWGKGYYQQALLLALDAYFQATGELYCTAHVDVSNIRSYKSLKKVGFADRALIAGPYGKQFELIYRSKKNPR